MKRIIPVLLIIIPLLLVSCSNDPPKNEQPKIKEMGAVEKKQHEIAQDAVKGMRDPIDKAKAVSADEDERNKEIKKAFDK